MSIEKSIFLSPDSLLSKVPMCLNMLGSRSPTMQYSKKVGGNSFKGMCAVSHDQRSLLKQVQEVGGVSYQEGWFPILLIRVITAIHVCEGDQVLSVPVLPVGRG